MKREILARLIEMAGQRRDEAAGKRARAQSAQDKAQATLAALEQYRQSHQQGRGAALQTLPGAVGLAVHARFGDKLDDAIDAQRSQCAALDRSLEQRAGELVGAQARLQALRALEQRRAASAARRLERDEQKLLDELASTRYLRSRSDR